MSKAVVFALALGAVFGASMGHIKMDPLDVGPAGGSQRFNMFVTHGCDGAPTAKLEVEIPTMYVDVSTAPLPQYMKGWTSSFDATTNIVTFQANSADDYLPDGTYMPFGLQVTLKDQTEALAPGDMVMALFKTTQTCVDASGVETSKYWSSMTHGADDTAPMIHISAPAEAMSTSDDDDSEGLATGALVVAIVALVGVLVNALNTFFLGRVLRKEIQAAQMEVNKAAV